MSVASFPVVICGSGSVGMTAAIELARHGIACVVLDKHPSTSQHPKARFVNVRSMEIIRQWGAEVYQKMLALDWPSQHYGSSYRGAVDLLSPATGILSSQDRFEPLFLATALALGVDIRFEHEVITVTQQADNVRVEVLDAQAQTLTLEAQYVIAADGASSSIRQQLGIAMRGLKNIGHYINVFFTSALAQMLPKPLQAVYWISHQQPQGVIQPVDGRAHWLSQLAYDGTATTLANFTPDVYRRWLSSALNKNVALDVISIGSWTMNAAVAENLCQNRVFLVGDAAHNMPPTGGYGLNTGMVGAHNLAWKLAYVLKQWAEPSLLLSYESEIMAVAIYNTHHSLDNARQVISDLQLNATDDLGHDFLYRLPYRAAEDIMLSYRYHRSHNTDPWVGRRLPHFWYQHGGQRYSSLDNVKTQFSLVMSQAQLWLEAAAALPPHLARSLRCQPLEGQQGLCQRHLGLEPSGAALIRPDGHISARWDVYPEQAAAKLAAALTEALR